MQFGNKHELLPTTFDSAVPVYSRKSSSSSVSLSNSSTSVSFKNVSIPYFISATSSPEGNDIQADDGYTGTNAQTLALDIRISFTVKIFFSLVRNFGGLLMTDGWSSVMKVLLWLFHLDLLPHELLFTMDDFTDADGVPLPSLSDPLPDNFNEHHPNSSQSAVSAVASWLSSAFSVFYEESAPINHGLSPEKQNPDFILQCDMNENEPEQKSTLENTTNLSQTEDEGTLDNLAPHPNRKCQNIINSLKECQIPELFAMSNEYQLNSFAHFVRTLISLSNTNTENVNTSTSVIATHTITSLDTIPIKTSILLMEHQSKARNEMHDQSMTNDQSIEEVICLPLTLDMKIFCLERLSQILSRNMIRVQEIWNPIFNHFQSLIVNISQQSNDRSSQYFFERIVVCVFKLCLELAEYENRDNITHEQYQSMKAGIFAFLNKFLNIQNDNILILVGRRIIAGIKLLLNMQYDKQIKMDEEKEDVSSSAVKQNSKCLIFDNERDWKIILFLIKRFACNSDVTDNQCCAEAFHVLEDICKLHMNTENLTHILNVLLVFGDHRQSAAVHCKQVIEVVLSLHSRLPSITDNNSVLGQMWHNSLLCIARFGAHTDYNTRRFAINSLHKALLQYPIKFEVKSHAEPSRLLFEAILLPLLLQVTRLENQRLHLIEEQRMMNTVHNQNRNNNTNISSINFNVAENRSDLNGSQTQNDLRLKLLSLLFQVWLHELANLLILDDFTDIWYKFLATIKEFLFLIASNDFLVTHCIESLKNVILVFQSSNLFDKVSQSTNTDVWSKTWNILADVTPNLKQEFQSSFK